MLRTRLIAGGGLPTLVSDRLSWQRLSVRFEGDSRDFDDVAIAINAHCAPLCVHHRLAIRAAQGAHLTAGCTGRLGDWCVACFLAGGYQRAISAQARSRNAHAGFFRVENRRSVSLRLRRIGLFELLFFLGGVALREPRQTTNQDSAQDQPKNSLADLVVVAAFFVN